MHVLHAHWHFPTSPVDGGGMLFWAEESEITTPIRGPKKRGKATPPHPFCAAPEAVKHILHPFQAEMADHQINWMSLLLPTTATGPQPSPHLLHDGERDESPPDTLTAWVVAGVWLSPLDAFDLLTRLPDTATPDLAFGVDLRYWQIVTHLILETLAQQKILPVFELADPEKKIYHARWLPILDGPQDGPRLARLLEAMPPLCRAETTDPNQAPSPRLVLETFLNTVTDALARQWGQPLRPLFSPNQVEPVHHWLTALFELDPQVSGSAAQLDHLRQNQQHWLRNLHLAGDKNFRVAFRLEAPAQQVETKNEKNWRLHYLLQARDDPSLLIPAQQVWQTKGVVLNALNHRFENPQEKLLAGLGYAAGLYEPLREGLKTAQPTSQNLTTSQAFDFLRESAPLLEDSGFGLLVPPWWNKPGRRLGMRLKLSTPNRTGPGADIVAASRVSFQRLIDYQWELSLGETPLTPEEFGALVALKSPLVQIRGQWVQLDPDQIEAAIQFWQKQTLADTVTLPEAMRLGLGVGATPPNLPIENVAVEGWLKEWLEKFTSQEKLTLLDPPQTLQAQLRPYQQYGYSWLDFLQRWGLGACLADDMGLGKCIAADTDVMVNGTLQKAEMIWHKYVGESQFDGEGFWATPQEPLWGNGLDQHSNHIILTSIQRLYRQHIREPLRKITLEDGSSLTITARHRLLTPIGWTNALQSGDDVCVPAKLVWPGQVKDPDLLKLLAWQIAEGYEHKKRATLTIWQKDISRLEDLRQTILAIGLRYNLKVNHPAIRIRPHKTSPLQLDSRAYQRFLQAKGYLWGSLAAEKIIPDFIMQADLQSIRLFLSHYFEAEGSLNKRTGTIQISSASALLLQQLGLLLRRFGIWLRIAAQQKWAINGSGISRTHYIGTMRRNAARLFWQEIGFVTPEKQQTLEKICARARNKNVEELPASELVAEAVKTSGLPLRAFGMYNRVYLDGSRQFSRARLEQVVSYIDQLLTGTAEQAYRQKQRSKSIKQTLQDLARLDKQYLTQIRQHLQNLLDQELFYCKIKKIETVPYEGWVYDFEVAHHHNFVANNILCHNTIQTISLLLREKEQTGALPAPTLIICPTSVVINWVKEVQRFAPSLTTLAHQGQDRLRDEAFVTQAKATDLVLTSYALARRDVDTLKQVEWHGLILDEAQNIKNPEAQQTRAIRTLSAQFRLALSGTPVENRLSELWSIMNFLNPGFMGSRAHFRQHFAKPIERFGDEEATHRLKKMVSPFILRRLKTDPKVIQDLPEKQEMKVYCSLSEEQATLYESVVQTSLQEVLAADGIQRKGLVLSMMMKLKQICNHPAQFLHQVSQEQYPATQDDERSGKVTRLTEMLSETLSVADRTLIFTQFAEMGHFLKSNLQHTLGVPVQFLHGGTPAQHRAVMVERFQTDPDGPPIFILSLKAGGTGLNLTRANHVFHFDRWWNPAVEDQATDRAFRIGQKQNVQVHKFICAGTLEERIDEMIEGKKALAESIVGGGESWLTELSTAALQDLVTLRREMLP